MARRDDAYRRLVAGEHAYFWRVAHAHEGDSSSTITGCRETVAIRREGYSGRVRIVFGERPGHIVGGGYLHGGVAVRTGDDTYLNLHRPAVARALLDEVLTRGWDPAEQAELDGWDLLDAVRTRVEDGAAET